MLAIRMQRTGRKGHAMFRVIVQDARRTPTSGKVVANLGHHDPHTKATTINKEKAELYLKNGAQPSERVVRLLQAEGITLPKWVVVAKADKASGIKNPDKLRKNQPAKPAAEEVPAEVESTEPAAEAEEVAAEAPAEAPAEEVAAAEVEEVKEA